MNTWNTHKETLIQGYKTSPNDEIIKIKGEIKKENIMNNFMPLILTL